MAPEPRRGRRGARAAVLLAGLLAVALRPGRADVGDGKDAGGTAFQSAASCAPCHPLHHHEWRGSAHAYSAADPIVVACIELASREAGPEMGAKCTGCHAPVLARTGRAGQLPDPNEAAEQGVTCAVCHRMRPGPEGSPIANAAFDLSPGNVYQGRLEHPVPVSEHEMATSDHIGSSVLCGSCHDVMHEGSLLETTYAQWERSIYSKERATSCQDCHMLRYSGQAAVGGPFRETLRRHNFPAVTVPLIRFPNRGYQEEEVQALLRTAAQLSVFAPDEVQAGGGLEIEVRVKNSGAGHNLPSGISSKRQVWVELAVEDAATGEALLRSGHLDSRGDLRNRHSLEDPEGDPFLQLFSDRLLDDGGREVTFFWRAKRLEERSLRPLEERTGRYVASVPEERAGSRLRVRARLLYRPFPPYALRELGLEHMAAALPIWEMASRRVEEIAVVRGAPRRSVHRYPGDFETLSAALSALRDGDTLLLGPGEHAIQAPLRPPNSSWTLRGVEGSGRTRIRYAGPREAAEGSVLILEASGEEQPASGEAGGEPGRLQVLAGLTLSGGAGTVGPDGTRRGGALLVRGASPLIDDVILEGSSAEGGAGGGAYLGRTRTRLERVRIEGCSAARGGGLVLGPGTDVAPLEIAIAGCEAEDGGGAFLEPGARGSFAGLEISGTRARRRGGAIFVSGGSWLDLDGATIVHSASTEGGALHAEEGSRATARHAILWFHEPGPGNVPAAWSLIEKGDGHPDVPGPARRDAFPLFVDPGGLWRQGVWIPGDYRLLHGSPAIDAGDPRAPPDRDDSRRDIGAHVYEQPLRAFIRGDADGDGAVGFPDLLLAALSLWGLAEPGCKDAMDVDDDGRVTPADLARLALFLAVGAPPPRPPHPACGLDPTFGEGLSCDQKGATCRGNLPEDAPR